MSFLYGINHTVERYAGTLQRRFARAVEIQSSGCWHMRGLTTRYMSFKSQTYPSARLAYALWNGEIHWGRIVHHRCENPLCVKPSHLVQLTRKEHAIEHERLREAA